MNAKGEPYAIQDGASSLWIWNETEVILADQQHRTFERIVRPPIEAGANHNSFFWPWLYPTYAMPLLFDLKEEEVRRDFRFKLLKAENGAYWIGATPITTQRAANHSQITLILDAKSFMPKAVRYVDPAGTKTSVYTFGRLNTGKPEDVTPETMYDIILGTLETEFTAPAGYKDVNNRTKKK